MTAEITPPRRRRIAYLTYSTAEFDSRTHRMARSATEHGYDVVVYARLEPGLPLESDGPGYRIIRAPAVAELAIPGFRGRGRRRVAELRRQASASVKPEPPRGRAPGQAAGEVGPAAGGSRRRDWVDNVPPGLRGTRVGAPLRRTRSALGRWRRRILLFPIRPLAWAVALDDVVQPADVWHGMWATSLPALARFRRLHGGRTVYDSRDLYIDARSLSGMAAPWKWLLGGLERRWARRCDAVVTVNDGYALVLARRFGIAPPPVVRNTPARYVRPTPPPDLLRERLGLPAAVPIVLYQGGLMSERGIEQGMAAILAVPDAVLVLMGFGSGSDEILRLAREPRYSGRVRAVEPAPPAELLDWTASSDIMLMAIQPTTLNHRLTTPNKLWEAIAAGVPVVASDLPGMAPIVRATGCGELVDPTDPADIARGIRAILDLPQDGRDALRERCLAAAAIYSWERETETLFELYGRLLGPSDPRVLPYARS
ncbi:MAG: glycosyltransferase [Chloroflexota bacterium]|nr:glycosyltransferase [Chloroflexota bacterium]